jgi:hypothetical protein
LCGRVIVLCEMQSRHADRMYTNDAPQAACGAAFSGMKGRFPGCAPVSSGSRQQSSTIDAISSQEDNLGFGRYSSLIRRVDEKGSVVCLRRYLVVQMWKKRELS